MTSLYIFKDHIFSEETYCFIGGIVKTFIYEFFKFVASYYMNFKQLLKEAIDGRKSCQSGTLKHCSEIMFHSFHLMTINFW